MFYDKEISIYKIQQGYTDENLVWHDKQEVLIGTFECDIQPYNTELLYKTYGIKENVIKRVFLDFNNQIKVGMICFYKDKKYIIQAIPDEWEDYMQLAIDDL